MITLQLLWICIYTQQINKITQPFPEILLFRFYVQVILDVLENLEHARACLTKPSKCCKTELKHGYLITCKKRILYLKQFLKQFFSRFPNYIDDKYNFSNNRFVTFQYIWKNILKQKKKFHWVDPKKTASHTDGRTDRLIDR